MRQSTIPRRSIRFDRGACGPSWPRVVSADCQLTSQVACQLNFPILSVFGLLFLSFFQWKKKGKFTMTDYYLVPAIRPPPEYFFEGLWACQCRLYSSDFVWNGPEIADRRKDKFVPNWLGPTVSIERLPLAAHVSSFLPSFHLRVGQTRRNVTNHFVVKWFIQILINEWIVISIRQPSVPFHNEIFKFKLSL